MMWCKAANIRLSTICIIHYKAKRESAMQENIASKSKVGCLKKAVQPILSLSKIRSRERYNNMVRSTSLFLSTVRMSTIAGEGPGIGVYATQRRQVAGQPA